MRSMEWLQLMGKILHGNKYLWSLMKKSSVSRMQRFTYFQILCYVLERWIRTQHQILLGKKNWVVSRVQHNTELWTQLTDCRWNSSGTFFPGFTTVQLINKVHEFMIKMSDPSQFKGRIIFMSMFNDILLGFEDNERECDANATLVSIFAKKFSPGRWSFLGPGSEK